MVPLKRVQFRRQKYLPSCKPNFWDIPSDLSSTVSSIHQGFTVLSIDMAPGWKNERWGIMLVGNSDANSDYDVDSVLSVHKSAHWWRLHTQGCGVCGHQGRTVLREACHHEGSTGAGSVGTSPRLPCTPVWGETGITWMGVMGRVTWQMQKPVYRFIFLLVYGSICIFQAY